jgi:hypothetical protein
MSARRQDPEHLTDRSEELRAAIEKTFGPRAGDLGGRFFYGWVYEGRPQLAYGVTTDGFRVHYGAMPKGRLGRDAVWHEFQFERGWVGQGPVVYMTPDGLAYLTTDVASWRPDLDSVWRPDTDYDSLRERRAAMRLVAARVRACRFSPSRA